MRVAMLFWILFLHLFSTSMTYDHKTIKKNVTTHYYAPKFSKNLRKYLEIHESNKQHLSDMKARIFENVEYETLSMLDQLKTTFNSKNIDSEEDEFNKMSKSKDYNINYLLVHEIKPQLSSQGTNKLLDLGHHIKNIFDKIDIYSFQSYISRDYYNELNTFINNIRNDTVNNIIERELFVLHTIESANAIFAKHCNKLYDHIITKLNITHDSNTDKVTKHIQEVITKEKKTNLKFICKRLEICKPFPSFSDHFAILLKEIVNLPDEHVKSFGDRLKQTVREKKHFFNTLVDPYTATVIDTTSQSLMKDIQGLRQLLNTVADLIPERNKIHKTDDEGWKRKATAMKVLIDMIDKAFELLGYNFVEINYAKVFSDLEDVKKKRDTSDVKRIVNDFIIIFKEVVDFYWLPQNRYEIKILTNVIVTGGKTDDGAAIKELLTKGSTFVRGETVTANLDKLYNLIDID